MYTSIKIYTALALAVMAGLIILRRASAKPVTPLAPAITKGSMQVTDGFKLYPVYRHIKSGGLYAYLRTGMLERTGELIVVYVPVSELETGEVWVRDYNEFHDGRFELVMNTNNI